MRGAGGEMGEGSKAPAAHVSNCDAGAQPIVHARESLEGVCQVVPRPHPHDPAPPGARNDCRTQSVIASWRCHRLPCTTLSPNESDLCPANQPGASKIGLGAKQARKCHATPGHIAPDEPLSACRTT